tara:strand:+ start:5683 stop:6459 length:777 start_codon:yes stop_codon:yes gene_type:complete
MPGVSIRPSDFAEGGAVPVDRNLTWKKCLFNLFDYQGKAPATVAAMIVYVDDDGQEFEQQYSVGDPERFMPSSDGKTLVATGEAQSLSKSSNFSLLMNALINAGFPENRLSDDISTLDGLYTFNIGLPEPKRAGLARVAVAGEPQREKVLSVPSQILRLPGEKGKGRAATRVPAATAGEEDGGGDEDADITAKALEFVASHLDGDGVTTRQKLAVAVFKDLAKDPDKDAIAGLIFVPEFAGALLANGYAVAGDNISKS